MTKNSKLRTETRLSQRGRYPIEKHGGTPINPPIQRASTIIYPDYATMKKFSAREIGVPRPHEIGQNFLRYGLQGTDSHFALEEVVRDLAAADDCLLLPSGLAAITLCYDTFTQCGGQVLVPLTVYHPNRYFCEKVLPRRGVSVQWYDPRIGADIDSLFGENAQLLFIESPGSLTFELSDVPALAAAARRHRVPSVIDNTWATPLYFDALAHGVDIDLHAGTKYFSGGSDLLLGTLASRGKIAAELRNAFELRGDGVSPEDAALALRGMRSLPVRLRQHEAGGYELAERLAAHPEVEAVIHPGRADHPDHAIFARDFSGAGGLFAFTLNSRYDEAAVAAFCDALELFVMGPSWGGFDSLLVPYDLRAMRPAAAWHETWQHKGWLMRVFCGLENPDDLWNDLERGFASLPKM